MDLLMSAAALVDRVVPHIHHEVRFTMTTFFTSHMSILGLSGSGDGPEVDVFVTGAGDVGPGGPGPSP